MSDDVRGKLSEWGLIDARASMAALPLTEHIENWHDDIINRGKTAQYADLLKRRVSKLFTACGFVRYADIDEPNVNRQLAVMRQVKDDELGASIQTTNHYAGSAKQFCMWMVKNRRAIGNPLAHLAKGNVATDRRYVRRALSIEEITAIVRTAKASKEIRNRATGAERALVYQLALETGLRRNEILTLTRDAFDLESEKPTLMVQASNAKNRKADVFAIQSDLAASLRLHLANKLPGAPAFRMGRYTAQMLHADCRDAGILVGPLTDRVDFHGNRKTFITNLGRAGVPLAMAQQLARHSDPRLTANVYTQFDNAEKRAAIEMRPKIAG